MEQFKQNISWKPEKQKKNSCWNKKGIKAKIPTNQKEKKLKKKNRRESIRWACQICMSGNKTGIS